MKKYKAKKMLKQSRFKDHVKTLNQNEYDLTIKYINKLIDENKEYLDKQNYGYLCNLFSSLALVWMYIDNGKSKQESQEIVFEAMYKFVKPKIKSMQKIAKHKCFVPILKKTMPIKFKRQCGYGWEISYPSAPKNRFTMVTHKCIFAQIFAKYDMFEMTKGFCKVDNILYSNLPNTKFYYSQRIGEGGKCCDYSFQRE